VDGDERLGTHVPVTRGGVTLRPVCCPW
jgi:hypothetical protein